MNGEYRESIDCRMESMRTRHYIKTGVTDHHVRGLDPHKPIRHPRTPYKSPHKRYIKPPKPKPRPVPQPAPLKPLNHTGQPFGHRNPTPTPKGPLGGLTPKGRRMLRSLVRVPALTAIGTILDFTREIAPGPELHWDLPGHGFSRTCSVPPNGGYTYVSTIPYSGGDTRAKYSTSSPNLPCTTTAQVADDNLTNGVSNIANNIRWVAFGPDNHGTVVRMQIREQWYRPVAGGPVIPSVDPAEPFPKPQYQQAPGGPLIPALDPLGLPIAAPHPTPRPVPYRMIPERRPNPNRSPDEQPQTRPRRIPRIPPDPPTPVEEIVVPRSPSKPPYTRPTEHVRAKPGPRIRERKLYTSVKSGTPLAMVLSLLTESLDLLNAFYKSLPKDLQQRGLNPFEKFMVVVENLDAYAGRARVGTLMTNIIAEIIEDEGYGRLGKAAARANQRLGTHLQRGPGDELGGQGTQGIKDPYIEALNEWLEGLLS